MEILIGTKRTSTWSMRPWLALKHVGVPFRETLVELRDEATPESILAAGSPTGLVPVLWDGDLMVWDSLAICEYLHERFPQARLWPGDLRARALGRAAVSEMHSGFQALRAECAMDLDLITTVQLTAAAKCNVRRMVALWSGLLARCGGPYLLGEDWSIADAFFTPVATRFRTYGVDLAKFGDSGVAAAYVVRLLQAPEFLIWECEARGG